MPAGWRRGTCDQGLMGGPEVSKEVEGEQGESLGQQESVPLEGLNGIYEI